MSLREIFCVFIDGLSKRNVYWYKTGYEEVKIDHPEVQTHFETIKSAVEDPFCVKQDKAHSNRSNYYMPFSGGREYPNHHMKVVVEKGFLTGRLRIITAFFVDYWKSGEEVLWSKK